MFTGLIQAVGQIQGINASASGGTLKILCPQHLNWGGVGASVAVDGVCLTIREWHGNILYFDVLAETFNRTNLKTKRTGSSVNLEPALRLGEPLGGHLITGHVDGVGIVRRIRMVGRDRDVTIGCDTSLTAQMVLKGSVSCDGISLTLVEVDADAFGVHIIPHTWERTAWRNLAEGDAVNIETDLIGKYVARRLERLLGNNVVAGGDMTWEKLREAGFSV